VSGGMVLFWWNVIGNGFENFNQYEYQSNEKLVLSLKMLQILIIMLFVSALTIFLSNFNIAHSAILS
jgi:hypothetical protein